MTCTTLEDVFLRINENKLLRLAAEEGQRTPQPSPAAPARRADALSDGSHATGLAVEGGASLLDPGAAVSDQGPQPIPASSVRGVAAQYAGLITKRRLTSRRDLCTTCCQLLFPVVLVLIALALLKVSRCLPPRRPRRHPHGHPTTSWIHPPHHLLLRCLRWT